MPPPLLLLYQQHAAVAHNLLGAIKGVAICCKPGSHVMHIRLAGERADAEAEQLLQRVATKVGSAFPAACLLICLSVYLSICLSVCLLAYLSACFLPIAGLLPGQLALLAGWLARWMYVP